MMELINDEITPEMFSQEYLKRLAEETAKMLSDKENKTIGIL